VIFRHEKHKNYHSKYPEVFLFEDQQQNQLPVFFGNVCLRFLPVLDILIHRFLEINSDKSIEMTLMRMGSLYKFHGNYILSLIIIIMCVLFILKNPL
jgi:mediator of RNA polymerase II transcription subunit 23